jgi:hypothetical protein
MKAKHNIPEYPGFTPQQNIDAWKLRSEIVDSYIDQGLLSTNNLLALSKMPNDITRTQLLLSILNNKEQNESKT